MRERMRFCHVTHSMKRIKIPLSHIRDKHKFKIETLYFFWFNVSRLFLLHYYSMLLLFVLFCLIFQDFSSQIRFAFPFTLFTSTLLYTHFHSLSYHPISNTLRQKTMSFTFNLSMTPT